MVQIMSSLLQNSDFKKSKKTTRPFKYNINQILCTYTLKVTNRFKELDLIDRLPKELWREFHNIAQEAVTKITTNQGNARGKVVV